MIVVSAPQGNRQPMTPTAPTRSRPRRPHSEMWQESVRAVQLDQAEALLVELWHGSMVILVVDPMGILGVDQNVIFNH